MKPAEIFVKHPTADAYHIGGAYQPYAIVGIDKRFTGAELASEYWRAKESCTFVGAFSGMPIMADNMLAKRLKILRRFAKLPHYDEADQ